MIHQHSALTSSARQLKSSMASQFVLLVQLFVLITAVHHSIETKCSTTIRSKDIWHKKLDYMANVIGGFGANHSMDCISGFGCMTFTCLDEEDNAQFVINSCAASKDKCFFSMLCLNRTELEEASDCCLAFCWLMKRFSESDDSLCTDCHSLRFGLNCIERKFNEVIKSALCESWRWAFEWRARECYRSHCDRAGDFACSLAGLSRCSPHCARPGRPRLPRAAPTDAALGHDTRSAHARTPSAFAPYSLGHKGPPRPSARSKSSVQCTRLSVPHATISTTASSRWAKAGLAFAIPSAVGRFGAESIAQMLITSSEQHNFAESISIRANGGSTGKLLIFSPSETGRDRDHVHHNIQQQQVISRRQLLLGMFNVPIGHTELAAFEALIGG
uniref:Uncharacterized protein n=1 Tax=Globodera rostochiensis TaxID=31243 RepID=A0A914HPW9_GLORO